MKTFIEYINTRYSNIKKQQIYNIASIIIKLCIIPKMKENRERFHAHEITEKFWTDLSSPIYKWLKSHGISCEKGIVPPFAQGGIGRAYFIGNKVVKMTTNKVEANVANLVKNRNDLPTVVIDVLPLENSIYAILQDYVDVNVPSKIKKAADYLTMIVDQYPDIEGYPDTPLEQERICKEILKNNNGPMELLPHMLTILIALAKLFNSTGFKHDDAGPSNIAMNHGNVVITDLGPNEHGNFDPNKTLEKIQVDRQKLGLPRKKMI